MLCLEGHYSIIVVVIMVGLTSCQMLSRRTYVYGLIARLPLVSMLDHAFQNSATQLSRSKCFQWLALDVASHAMTGRQCVSAMPSCNRRESKTRAKRQCQPQLTFPVMLLQALSVSPMAAAATPSRVSTGVPSCHSGRLPRQLLQHLPRHPACLQSALPPLFQANPPTVGCNPPRLRAGCSHKPAWVPRPVGRVPPWTSEQGQPRTLRPKEGVMLQPTCPACSLGAWD